MSKIVSLLEATIAIIMVSSALQGFNFNTVQAMPDLLINPSTIDWGTMAPNTVHIYFLNITNTGNIQVYLTMRRGILEPIAGLDSRLILMWNRQGYKLRVGETTQAILTLNVGNFADNLTGDIDFIMQIIIGY